MMAQSEQDEKTINRSTHLKEEAEADPLVVLVLLPVNDLALAVSNARIGNLAADLLLEEALQGVRGVDPAVRVEHILGYVFRVHAVYRVAHVLPRGHDQREGHEHHDGDAVVQPEHGRVYGNVADFDEVFEAPENVQHVSAGVGRTGPRGVMALLLVLVAGHET